MNNSTYDCIVIGAGIEGSSTAYHLAKSGKKTLLLEQFFLPHTRGSSHGQSRIIRKAYEEEYYVRMMQDAYQQWFDIEKETKTSLYRKTGMLWLEENPADQLLQTEAILKKLDFKCKRYETDEFKVKYPMLNYGNNYKILFDEEAGVLKADKCLRALQDLYVQYGGTIQDGCQVTGIEPGPFVRVMTKETIYKAAGIVITAGPWTNKLTSPIGLKLPLQPMGINVCYWKHTQKFHNPYSYGVFPVIIHNLVRVDNSFHDIYGLPSEEYPDQMKLCLHTGTEVDPDQRDLNDSRWDVEILCDYVKRHFPLLEPKPSIIEKCIYTVTPDHDFILDCHPKWPNIVIGAGFSGHGFKLAPVVGRVLSEKILGMKPSHNLRPFTIKRFQTKSSL